MIKVKNIRASPSSDLQARTESSSYPGTGTAFTNGWKYLNFDVSTDADKVSVEIIDNAFDGMRRPALAGISSAVANDVVYQRFFPEDRIIAVLRQIIPENLGNGSQNTLAAVGPLLVNVVIDSTDFNNAAGVDPNYDNEGVQAYTDRDTGHVHFCAIGLAYKIPVSSCVIRISMTSSQRRWIAWEGSLCTKCYTSTQSVK